jgi:hypothetical protein
VIIESGTCHSTGETTYRDAGKGVSAYVVEVTAIWLIESENV